MTISGNETVEPTSQFQSEKVFLLRKWSSNVPELLYVARPQDKELQLPLSFDNKNTIELWGLYKKERFSNVSINFRPTRFVGSYRCLEQDIHPTIMASKFRLG
ncbi:hypothetical protein PR048_010947 [Dryococelus australis]|uniref:Uncharacterized protein n=1 Tax=Dryococelus australis TaxID=614101 RepID=A0ABQ9HKW2_9NEOP|nr:hypothetical protein PR048_010947 [Dryococelus australis]